LVRQSRVQPSGVKQAADKGKSVSSPTKGKRMEEKNLRRMKHGQERLGCGQRTCELKLFVTSHAEYQDETSKGKDERLGKESRYVALKPTAGEKIQLIKKNKKVAEGLMNATT